MEATLNHYLNFRRETKKTVKHQNKENGEAINEYKKEHVFFKELKFLNNNKYKTIEAMSNRKIKTHCQYLFKTQGNTYP
jgi:hypothetical protein